MKMPNWLLLKQRALRLFQRRKTYEESCDRYWTIAPFEENPSPPAIYLEKDVDKITDVQPDSTYAGETGRLHGGPRAHAPTIAYQFSDVHILYGYGYKGAVKLQFVAAKESWFATRTKDHLSNALMTSTVFGSRYFGHWMTEDLPLTIAAQQLGVDAVAAAQVLFKHQVEYHRLLDVHPIAVNQARCDQLIVLDDFGQNQFKRKRYEKMRNQLKKLEPLHSNHNVMFLRKGSGMKRLLVNEMEIAEFLSNQGFVLIDPESMTVTEIIRHALGANIVIGVEGSQLLHGLFAMSDTGTILALQPPYRFSTIHKDFTDCLGMRYGFLVGDQVPEGFKVDLGDLARVLEKVDSEAS